MSTENVWMQYRETAQWMAYRESNVWSAYRETSSENDCASFDLDLVPVRHQ
jgi:hypothetical protein